MPALTATTVRRGGVTASHWYETIRSVAINAESELRIRFSMSSKGGGYTDVQVEIRPEDFSTVLEMMTLVDRQAAMEAMSAELARQVASQPGRDAETIKRARAAVQDLAFQKYVAKPHGEDERERIVNTGVKELISELESAHSPTEST